MTGKTRDADFQFVEKAPSFPHSKREQKRNIAFSLLFSFPRAALTRDDDETVSSIINQ